jgi:hypothetical protein
MDNVLWQIVWLACGVATIIAGVLASRSRRARYVGRAAVGVLFIGLLVVFEATVRSVTWA